MAQYAQHADAKPVAALIVGRTAPLGKKMGHAAAMIGGYSDGHEAKIKALLAANVQATGRLAEVVAVTQAAIDSGKRKIHHEPHR